MGWNYKETSWNQRHPPPARPPQMGYQRIATEEAFAPREMLDIYRKLLAHAMLTPASKPSGFLHEQPQRPRPAHHALPADLDQVRLQHAGRGRHRPPGDRAHSARRSGHGRGHCRVVRMPGQRPAGRGRAPPPNAFHGHDRRARRTLQQQPKKSSAGHEAGHEFRHHPIRIRRASIVGQRILGHLCCCRSAPCAYLPAPPTRCRAT